VKETLINPLGINNMSYANSVHIPAVLVAMRNVNGYSDAGEASKKSFHLKGKKFLAELARALGVSVGTYSVRSNVGGVAVSGEVTLHTDNIYIQLSDYFGQPGISMMYRSCTSQKDYTGGRNHTVKLADLGDEDTQYRILKDMRSLIDTEMSRKKQQTFSRATAAVSAMA
jgi:hypothetical protein